MYNNKKIKTKTWFINWFKYFQVYLEMARIGLLQLDEQKYSPKNAFDRDALYDKDKILLIPIIWSFKHSIELLIKSLDTRITQKFSSVHDNAQLHEEIKKAFSKLKIEDSELLKEFIALSDKYFKLKFWDSFVEENNDICDRMNDIFRYPENKVNFRLKIEELHKVTKDNLLELNKDIKILDGLAWKLYREITLAKI